MSVDNVILIEATCRVPNCANDVRAMMLVNNEEWEGFCLRHMTILVLESTAHSMDLEIGPRT